MLVRRRLLYSLLVLTACQSAPRPPAGGFAALPWSSAAADVAVLRARQLVERGEVRDALAEIDRVLAAEPAHVDALRLRQDTLRERGRRGLLLHEANEAVRSEGTALAHYLRGRIGKDRDQRMADFLRAAQLDPASLWPWLGIAHALRQRDPQAAARVYQQLVHSSDGHPLVVMARASLQRERGDAAAALASYESLQGDPRCRGLGYLGAAQALLQLGREEEAWQAATAALRQRPYDPELQGLLQSWLRSLGGQERSAELLDLLREDPQRWQAFTNGPGRSLLVELLQQARQPHAALGLLTDTEVARRPALQRLQRRLLLAVGDLDGFLAAVRHQVPRAVVADERNQLRGRWLRLLDADWTAAGQLAAPAKAVELLQSLLQVGFLVEAEQVAGLALLQWPADLAIEGLLAEVRRQLAFEAGLRRLVYRGYRAASGAERSIQTVLGELRELSLQVFGRDVVGEPTVFRLPLLGEMVDPFAGPLAEHFARYNRHCILGRRSGGVPEALLLSRLSLAELPPVAELPLRGRCYEVIACDREVRSWSTVVGGDLAGVALLQHFLIDYDAVQEWARSLAERRSIVAADGGAALLDPLPADAGMDPLDAGFRLAVASPVPDAELDAAVLDMIRCHERQHLVDSFYFLPVERNLARGLWLWLRFGMSPAAIHAEMERRAELAALALSPHTELVLAHIADFLADGGGHGNSGRSPHHRGFGDLAHQLVAGLRRAGLSADAVQPSRWHLLDPALVRQVAAAMLREL